MSDDFDRARFELWRKRAEAALSACAAMGGDRIGPELLGPATEKAVRAVEKKLALELPKSFRRVLLRGAARFDFAWFLPESAKPPFRDIFAGDFGWNLDTLEQLEQRRMGWVSSCFPDPRDRYHRVWHEKLAIHAVANGDLVAIDLREVGQPLVYLSHDGGSGHGLRLGADFEDAVDRWSRIGFVGAEDWQWMPFRAKADTGLDPDGPAAKRWRKWFRLDQADD